MSGSTELPESGLVARPPFQLRSLPIPVRWQVTRRHPYYQNSWRAARDFRLQAPLSHPAEEVLRSGALATLLAIGVGGAPVDPSCDDLECDGLAPAWLTGAVQPLTLRQMASLMLTRLSPEELQSVADVFVTAGREPSGEEDLPVLTAMSQLQLVEGEALDRYPDEPLVSVNPAASVRQVHDALTGLLADWKRERQLGDRRLHEGKLRTYLEVWDCREGWSAGRYDPCAVRTIEQVAAQLGLSRSTTWDRYRRAFEMIIGHDYSPELWWRVVGQFLAIDLGVVPTARPMRSRSVRPVPETTLGVSPGNMGDDGPHAAAYTAEDLRVDVQLLVREGKTDAEIVTHLDLPAGRDVLAWLRIVRDNLPGRDAAAS